MNPQRHNIEIVFVSTPNSDNENERKGNPILLWIYHLSEDQERFYFTPKHISLWDSAILLRMFVHVSFLSNLKLIWRLFSLCNLHIFLYHYTSPSISVSICQSVSLPPYYLNIILLVCCEATIWRRGPPRTPVPAACLSLLVPRWCCRCCPSADDDGRES